MLRFEAWNSQYSGKEEEKSKRTMSLEECNLMALSANLN
jgi:hypothetical protein